MRGPDFAIVALELWALGQGDTRRDDTQIVRHRWRARTRQQLSDDTRNRHEARYGGRAHLHARRSPPPCGDRQGYASVRLHDRAGFGCRLYCRRHGCFSVRSVAVAGRCHADALAARRSRRDDIRLSQRLSRQRHQAVRPGRQQAFRRDRTRNRKVDGRGFGRRSRRAGQDRPRQARYIEFAKRTFPRNLRLEGLRIVIDCANGAAYKVAPEVLWELGAEVFKLGVSPDGFNINEDCGSTAPAAMAAKVREMRADFGIALDGDADRVVMTDEHGRIIDGDQILALIANSWSARGTLKGDGVVGTVMSNMGLERFLASKNMKLARSAVGDRYVIEEMRKGGFNVGGEQSGHIILSDFSTTGDGLIAALQVLAVLAEGGKPASEAAHLYEPLPQVLENVRFRSGTPLDDSRVKSQIAEGTAKLNGKGRILVRKSGTEPVIRVMAEGEDEREVRAVVRAIASAIKDAAA